MPLRIALFGQAAFGEDVLVRLLDAGHEIVGGLRAAGAGRPDPLAEEAEKRGLAAAAPRGVPQQGRGDPGARRRVRRARRRAERARLRHGRSCRPRSSTRRAHGSLCFHPSLLPRYRGGAALAWQIILGAKRGRRHGVPARRRRRHRADRGAEGRRRDRRRPTPPRRSTSTSSIRSASTRWSRRSRRSIAGSARDRAAGRGATRASRASSTDEVARIDWSRSSADEIDRWIRGCDPSPGRVGRARERRARAPLRRALRRRRGRRGAGHACSGSRTAGSWSRRVGGVAIGKLRVGDGAKAAAPAIFAAGAVEAGERASLSLRAPTTPFSETDDLRPSSTDRRRLHRRDCQRRPQSSAMNDDLTKHPQHRHLAPTSTRARPR